MLSYDVDQRMWELKELYDLSCLTFAFFTLFKNRQTMLYTFYFKGLYVIAVSCYYQKAAEIERITRLNI